MSEAHHIFDRAVHVARRAAATGEAAALLDQRIAEELAERLAIINRSFADTALVAAHPDTSREILVQSGKCFNISVLSPSPDDILNCADESLDCLVSLLDLQTINDVPGHLAQAARALRPDGLALFAFFAGETLRELREAWLSAEAEVMGGASARVAPFIPLSDAGGLLQRAGFTLPVTDVETHTVRYGHPLRLMAELKALGAQNPLAERPARPVTRKLLQAATEAYGALALDADARVRATLELIWMSGWAPHESQQQPLRPGSARARLADALGVAEKPLPKDG